MICDLIILKTPRELILQLNLVKSVKEKSLSWFSEKPQKFLRKIFHLCKIIRTLDVAISLSFR